MVACIERQSLHWCGELCGTFIHVAVRSMINHRLEIQTCRQRSKPRRQETQTKVANACLLFPTLSHCTPESDKLGTRSNASGK